MAEDVTQTPREYTRFAPIERFEHIILVVTFVGLALTGLPQKYAAEEWAKTLINVMGGIESIRIVHRILATILMAESIYHGGIITYKLFVLGRRATMIPGVRDLRDVIQWVGFNLGLTRSHPHLPRYNFGEKAEYLAVVWGTVVMIITGFMMWNPITTSSVLPGEVIPAARVAHGSEALLAVLSILIWHMYNVHVRRFNRSMFTGKLSREAMVEEHAEELEAIEKGEKPSELSAEVIETRKRRFWPYATVMTVLLVGGLIWFVTFESTSITTLPRQLSESNALVTVSEDVGDPAEGAALWQTLECKACHGENAEGGSASMNVILAGTHISFESFVDTVRRGPADMHPFSVDQITDEQLAHLYVWLRALER
jgi:cytochrome b subunit of formate dehydrogenase